jgi:hypothetical protein
MIDSSKRQNEFEHGHGGSIDLPAFLPDDLSEAARFSTDQELFDFLVQNTEKLTRFFLYAADDETWSSNHLEFHSLTFAWMTESYMKARLGQRFAREIVRGIHQHFDLLSPLLPRPLTVSIEERSFDLNPLIVGTMCPFFRDLVRSEAKSLSLTDVDPALAAQGFAYMERGAIADLWKWSEKEIESLLNLSEKWGLEPLSNAAQVVLCRYATKENFIPKLLQSVKKGRKVLVAKCIDLFNDSAQGARLVNLLPEGLGFEFLDFLDKTLLLFEPLKQVITHLIVGGKLTLEEAFRKVMDQCPNLIGLDVSDSDAFSPYFSSIPNRVQELACARCLWLNDATLRDLTNSASQIRVLNLAQNTQLSYLGLGELKRFFNLRQLDLSRCHQLGDSELIIVLQAAPQLTSLRVFGCKKLTDQAFYDLAKRASHLQTLDLTRTAITDGGLIEIGTRCKALQSLHLDHCVAISDLGLRSFLRLAPQLQKLSFKESLLEEGAIEALREAFPKVEIAS